MFLRMSSLNERINEPFFAFFFNIKSLVELLASFSCVLFGFNFLVGEEGRAK